MKPTPAFDRQAAKTHAAMVAVRQKLQASADAWARENPNASADMRARAPITRMLAALGNATARTTVAAAQQAESVHRFAMNYWKEKTA